MVALTCSLPAADDVTQRLVTAASKHMSVEHAFPLCANLAIGLAELDHDNANGLQYFAYVLQSIRSNVACGLELTGKESEATGAIVRAWRTKA